MSAHQLLSMTGALTPGPVCPDGRCQERASNADGPPGGLDESLLEIAGATPAGNLRVTVPVRADRRYGGDSCNKRGKHIR